MDTIRAIIFDLDGVICFTDNYHYQAWKELADAEGIYFDEKINGRLRGVSRMESLDIILERASRCYTQEEKEQLATRKNESYVRLLEKMSPRDLSDEVKNTLDTLRQRGYKLAMDSVMAVFNDNISALHKVMAEMNNGITNISTVVEENAQGISSATENVSDLANSITNIRQQATENVDSSKHLMEEMNRFQKI